MESVIKQTIIASFIIFTCARAMDADKKHVLVPLEGVLFQVNTKNAVSELGYAGGMSTLWNLGLRGSLKSAWNATTGQAPDQKVLATKLFALLNAMPYQPSCAQDAPKVYWQGLEAPHLLVHGWMQGNKKCADLEKSVLAHIAANTNSLERPSLTTSAQIMFDPTKNAQTLQEKPEAIELLKSLRARGHMVHVVDNWNGEALESLQKEHAESFKEINGHTFVSGRVGKVKAANSTQFQEAFFAAHREIDPKSCLLIETEEEHVKPLVGTYQHVLCKDGNVAQLRETLERIGLLKK